MRHGSWCLIGALAFCLAAAGCTRDGADPEPATCPTMVAPSGLTPTTPTDRSTIPAPSGGAVTITESGFSPIADKTQISIGTVLINNSSQVAYHTRAIFRAFTAKGTSAIFGDYEYNYFIEVPAIRPGERIPVGATVTVDPAQFNKTGVPLAVATARLDLVSTQWVPAGATSTYPTVVAKLVPSDPPKVDGRFIAVPFDATSNACGDLGGRGVTAIFRNTGGKIVGGVFDGNRKETVCMAGEFHARVLPVDPAPPAADLPRTEVAVFCDVTPATFARPGPDQPSN